MNIARPAPGALVDEICRRYFLWLALLVLALGAFNLFNRLGEETVTEWDEALYATSAAEMVHNGQWAATTFLGETDYYNTKPPLNVWLIAISFKLFGINLWALRLPSALAGLCAVALLLAWARYAYSPTLAVAAGLVLATSFSFYYVHSGRTANPDALFSLVTLMTVVSLWLLERRPVAILMVALSVAAAFLLKGSGALLLAAVVAAARWKQPRATSTPLRIGAGLVFAVPVAAWTWARWNVDGSRFFDGMVFYDMIARTLTPLEGHRGSLLFYANVMQKYQYEWIIASVAAWSLYPASWRGVSRWFQGHRWVAASSVTTRSGAMLFLVPSMMQTKLAWYGLPLLPYLSLAVAACFVRSARLARPGGRRWVLAALALSAVLLSETRLIWHSYERRDLASSDQGLMLAHASELAGHRVYRKSWNLADRFVATHLIGCSVVVTPNVETFVDEARAGDFWLVTTAPGHPPLEFVGTTRRYALYRK